MAGGRRKAPAGRFFAPPGYSARRMRGAYLAFCLALLALVGSAWAQAQKPGAGAQPAPPVVAVVDVQLILREAAAAKGVREAVESRRTAFERELDKVTQELRKAEEELRRQQSQLGSDDLAPRKRELERRYGDLRRRTEERRTELTEAYNVAMRQVRQEMARALAEVMKDRGVDISMSRAAVLVFDDKLDITREVIDRLNRRLPKVEVKFEPAPPPAQN